MSVRQYIGARYVPRFLGTWNNTTQYEALDVVDNGSGTSYIARKTVPAGTPLTDTEFWFIYGASSGAIIDLQNRVGNIENVEIPALDSRIDAADAELIRIKRFSKKNVVWIGDSYGDEATEHPNIINTIIGFRSFYNLSTGSTGFTGKEGSASQSVNLEWKTILKNWVDQQTADTLASIDDVYISGGFNDVYSTSVGVIRTYISNFMSYARSVLPNAEFHLCFCGWAAGTGSVTTPTETALAADFRFRLANKVMIAYSQCEQFGMEYMGNAINALHNYDVCFNADQYHPNATGQERLARQILNYMLGGGSLVYTNYIDGNPRQPFTIDSLYEVAPYRTLFKSVSYTNDSIIFRSTGEATDGIPHTVPNTIPARTATTIGTFKSTYLAPVLDGTNRIYYSLPVYVQTLTGCLVAELLLYAGGTLQLYCYSEIPANTNFNIILRAPVALKIWDC